MMRKPQKVKLKDFSYHELRYSEMSQDSVLKTGIECLLNKLLNSFMNLLDRKIVELRTEDKTNQPHVIQVNANHCWSVGRFVYF